MSFIEFARKIKRGALSLYTPQISKISARGKDINVFTTAPTEYNHFVGRDLANERRILEDFLSQIPEDGVLWDIGAAYGLYSCFAAVHWSGHICSFEPDPARYLRLVENTSLNELDVDANNFALGEASGRMRIPVNSATPYSSRLGHHVSELEVRKHTADNLISCGLPKPTVVKIDVEGAEMNVLNGMSKVIDGVDLVYVEVHPPMIDYDPGMVDEFLHGSGFNVQRIDEDEDHTQYHVRGKK